MEIHNDILVSLSLRKHELNNYDVPVITAKQLSHGLIHNQSDYCCSYDERLGVIQPI